MTLDTTSQQCLTNVFAVGVNLNGGGTTAHIAIGRKLINLKLNSIWALTKK